MPEIRKVLSLVPHEDSDDILLYCRCDWTCQGYLPL